MYNSFENENENFVKSLNNLAKFNNGVFKSFKQKKFLYKKFESEQYQSGAILNMGINDTNVNFCRVFYVEYLIKWADYGTKSQRWMGWVYEYDNYGIKKYWRLHYTYNKNGVVSINKEKTELVWTRNEEILDVEHLIEAEKIENEKNKALEEKKANSNFIGEVGDKIETEVKVVFTKYIDNYDFPSTLFVMEDNDENKLVWFSSSMYGDSIEQNKKYIIKGRIKANKEFDGEKQTVMTRCKLTAVEA